ncbi:MAG: single-stranded DNA-binding protein [Phycisphaerales bacterium]
MAGSFNKVVLMGNLTRDVEVRHTANNLAIAKFGLACNRRWKTAEGEQRDEAMFIDCEAFGKTAEFVSQFFSKGRPILIEGRLKLDQWEDKETKAKRSKHLVVVESFHFVDSKPGGGGGGGGGGNGGEDSAPSRAPAAAGARSAPAPQEWGGKGPMGEDDIPF